MTTAWIAVLELPLANVRNGSGADVGRSTPGASSHSTGTPTQRHRHVRYVMPRGVISFKPHAFTRGDTPWRLARNSYSS